MPATRSFISLPAATDVIEKNISSFLNYYYYISRDYTSKYAQHLWYKIRTENLFYRFIPTLLSISSVQYKGEKNSPFTKKKKGE